jgi:AcrR family transcriptional regulator
MEIVMTSSDGEQVGSDSLERILREATMLFAEYGYHGVSTRAIAKAVGLNISTVNYHAGSKEELYHKVFHRLFLHEFEVVSRLTGYVDDSVVDDPAALRNLLEQLIDALIDMTLESPEVPRLWVRRCLEREFQFENIEVDFSLPLYEMVRNLLERARRAGAIRSDGPNTRLLLISVTWMLYGYFTGGPIAWNLAEADPFDPEQIDAFREFMHDYVFRMLDL